MSSVAEKSPRSKGLTIGIAAAGVLAAIGVGLWAYQLIAGMSSTGMGNANSWGIYIMGFMFMVGAATGSMMVVCVPRALGSTEFNGLSKVAAWLSICCTVLAIGFVLVDLGRPFQVWELFAYSNLGSPLMWDIIVLPLFLIVSVVYLWVLMRGDEGKVSSGAVRAMTFVALAMAALVCTVDAWIFGLQHGREAWNTAMLAPWFVASALSSGLALLLVVMAGLRGLGFSPVSDEARAKLVKVLGVLVLADLYFLLCEVVTDLFAGAQGVALVSQMVSGSLAPFFWTEVAAGVAAAALCFFAKRPPMGLVAVAGALVLVGVFFKRFQFLMSGFVSDGYAYPGVVTPAPVNTMAISYAGYLPSALELGVVLGVIGLGLAVFLAGVRALPILAASNAR